MRAGTLDSLTPGSFNIVLGTELARALGIRVGDSVVAITPQGNITPAGALPRLKSFHVSGVFEVGMQLLYGPNTGESNNGCYESKAYDGLYEKSLTLPPTSVERNHLFIDMADIRAGKGVGAAVKPEERKATLPFGGDKWGRDVLKKTIKGSETSIFVGLAAAAVATFLGTVFGAFAGYYGRWVDDFFNWFYNVFTAIPSILMILTVAAVLQQKGVLTIVLILGLTGWTGPYRLIRAEYIKHKAREYVMAATSPERLLASPRATRSGT